MFLLCVVVVCLYFFLNLYSDAFCRSFKKSCTFRIRREEEDVHHHEVVIIIHFSNIEDVLVLYRARSLS